MASILKSIKPSSETLLFGDSSKTMYFETIVVTNIGSDSTFTIKIGTNSLMTDDVMYLHNSDTILANETKYINLYISLESNNYIWVSSGNSSVIFKIIG